MLIFFLDLLFEPSQIICKHLFPSVQKSMNGSSILLILRQLILLSQLLIGIIC